MANCLTHGKEYMQEGVCLACEEMQRQAWEEERHQEEMRELENREMEEHFRRHPHG